MLVYNSTIFTVQEYSPPVNVNVQGLNIPTARGPILVQLHIENNKRNLQIQLAHNTGLNVSVVWSAAGVPAPMANNSCNSDCIAATLTTNRCGVPRPLISQLGLPKGSEASHKVFTTNQNAFRWTDGTQIQSNVL